MLNCYCQLSSSVIFRKYGVSQSECKIDRPRPWFPHLSPCPHTEALGTRLGQPYMIVDSFIVSIVKGPSVMNGDGKSLQKLADKCQSVLKTLESMKSLNEINTDHMRKIVARLPYHNQSRWRDRASVILRERVSPLT